jgi:tetratricopeptide (TPR) repeat protein
LCLGVLISSCLWSQPKNSEATACYSFHYPGSYLMYSGSFQRDDFNFAEVRFINGELLLKPYLWTTTQRLEEMGVDSFVSRGHPNLSYKFNRNPDGRITSVTLYGFKNESGFYKKNTEKVQPLDLILAGAVQKGFDLLLARHPSDSAALLRLGKTLNEKFTTRVAIAKAYLQLLIKRFPHYAEAFTALGNACLKSGQIKQAIEKYKTSLHADPNNQESLANLQALHVLPYSKMQMDSAYQLPFTLDALFKKPTAHELKEVWNEWAARDLSVKEVKLEDSGFLNLGTMQTRFYILSQRIGKYRHYGAVILPPYSGKGKRPAIVELKGVSPSYFPMNLNNGLYAYQFLCEEAARFVYIIPSFRGEKLICNGKEYLSEGDRANSWDGATDDAISLLTAAIDLFPEIDRNKVAAFGKSRGGGVALLMGIRDKRIKLVLDWAGPADWFSLMGQEGFTQQQLVEQGIIHRSTPFEVGGQFIERILLKSISGTDGLAAARKRMIAASPLYFLDHLPETQGHYGIEDGMVPLRNGKALLAEFAKHKKSNSKIYFHSGAGHDLNEMIAFSRSREFLLKMLR